MIISLINFGQNKWRKVSLGVQIFFKFVYINKSVKNNYAGKENVILIFENKKKLEILFFKMQMIILSFIF